MPVFKLLACLFALVLTACGTTDNTLTEQGKSPTYIQGFHDGRHSGMSEEGNNYEHYIRDEQRYVSDTDYRQGWLDGEAEGKRLQDQAVAVGEALGGAYSGAKISEEAEKQGDLDKAARDAVKNVDTTGLESLEKQQPGQ